jgi:hypothetical protein
MRNILFWKVEIYITNFSSCGHMVFPDKGSIYKVTMFMSYLPVLVIPDKHTHILLMKGENCFGRVRTGGSSD